MPRTQPHPDPSIKIDKTSLRYARLRKLFEGRSKQLDSVKVMEWGSTGRDHAYGRAVVKYVRARLAWRRARGWHS